MSDATNPEAFTISSQTSIATVGLAVSDLATSVPFYRDLLGMNVRETGSHYAALSFGGASNTLVLREARDLLPASSRVGLFHVAYLYPDRRRLADALFRLVEAGWEIQGAADHSVSQAIYLSDPEGNGIELYRDRSRRDWIFNGSEVFTNTTPFDLNALLKERDATGEVVAASVETRIGHIHLRVGSLPIAQNFYSGALGFELMTTFPGALFMAAGGYHHHLGLNTWGIRAGTGGSGSVDSAEGRLGLEYFSLELPLAQCLSDVVGNLEAQGKLPVRVHDFWSVKDPFGIEVRLGLPAGTVLTP